MTTNKSINSHPQANDSVSDSVSPSDLYPTQESKPSLVPKGFTIGLAVFSIVLSLAGYIFRYINGEPIEDILRHAAVIVPGFVIGVPLLFWIGALIMNKAKGMHIQRRNALTLGWLISCVTMLWLMGSYS
ncbi:hypothetical protein [Psychrobacter sp.]|uniref:hypothetical protein n=1 Tax=Psychrobacter sp. TaxID=56811 RepID=UPI0025FE13D6|nr:hypothetical protein [Psychrobacter sp.]